MGHPFALHPPDGKQILGLGQAVGLPFGLAKEGSTATSGDNHHVQPAH